MFFRYWQPNGSVSNVWMHRNEAPTRFNVGSQMPRHLISDCMGEVDDCFLDVKNEMTMSPICSYMFM